METNIKLSKEEIDQLKSIGTEEAAPVDFATLDQPAEEEEVLTAEQAAAIDQDLIQAQAENEMDLGDAAQTFAEGAASSLTFGLSEQAQKNLRTRAEQAAAKLRKEKYSKSGIAGEVAGIAGSMLSPGGLAKVVGSGVRGAAKAGQVAEKMSASMLKGILKGSADKKIVNEIIKRSSAAAGSGVEGAFYGVGNLLKEDALGNSDFNAENLIGSIGTGAILGAGLSGGLGAASAIGGKVAKALPKVKGAGGKILGSPREAAVELWNINGKAKEKLLRNQPKLVDDILEFTQKEINLKPWTSASDRLNSLRAANSEANTALNNIYKTLNDSKVVIPNKKFYGKLADDLEAKLITPYKTPEGSIDPLFRNEAIKVQKLIKNYRKIAEKPGYVNAAEMRALRSKADKKIFSNKKNLTKDALEKDAAYAVRSSIRDSVDNLATLTEHLNPKLGKLAQALKDANKKSHVTTFLLDKVDNGIDKDLLFKTQDYLLAGIGYGAAGPVGLAVAGARKFMQSDLKRKVAILSSMERANKKVQSTISTSIKSFFNSAKKAAIPATTNVLLNSNFTKVEKDGKLVEPSNKKEAVENLTEVVKNINSDPAYMERRILAKFYTMAQAAPETAQAAVAVANRAASFLQLKLAGIVKEKPGLFARKVTVSDLEVSKISKYLEAIENPLEALNKLQEGTLTRAHVEALKAVYPDIYKRVQSEAMKYIGTHKDLSYGKKVQLGILLDIPADPTLTGMGIAELQATFNPEVEQSNMTSGGGAQMGNTKLRKANTEISSLTSSGAESAIKRTTGDY